MLAIARLISGLVVIASVNNLFARTLRVPSEYALIQSAIDSSQDADTILVDSGLYSEALTISGRSLTIIGMNAPDTVNQIGTIIDPAGVIGSNELACLTLRGGDSVKLEQLWFRNGPAMHIDRATNDPGGIDNESGSQLLTLSSCRFDSVYNGIWHGVTVVLDRVVMHDMRQTCILYGDSGRIVATDCRFDGAMSGVVVSAWSGSRFHRCHFTNSLDGYLIIAARDSIQISECDFGPFQSDCSYAAVIRPGNGTVIENNIFHDIETGGIAVRVIQGNCSTIVDPAYQFPVIRGNTFRNIGYGSACQNGYALHLTCDGFVEAFQGTVEGNVFENSFSQGVFANAIYVNQGAAIIHDNRFVNLRPNNCAAIYSRYVQSPETLLLRGNEFDSLEYAIEHSTNLEITDARWNWWGDNSGPFNASSNPTGLGAEVDDGVIFDPWITREDTTDTNSTASDGSTLFPGEFIISAYPNPFNSATTLVIEVARAGEYEMMLYDVTGRVAAEVFRGRIELSRHVSVDAKELASGVYFAQLRGAEGVLAVGKILLLR